RLFQNYFSKKQLQSIHKLQETFEHERLEIFQQVTYDSYFESLYDICIQLIQNQMPTDAVMLIWKEKHHFYILEQLGKLKGTPLSAILPMLEKLEREHIVINDQAFLTFNLNYNGITSGYLLLGNKIDGSPFTPNDIMTILELSKTIAKTLKTAEILYHNQKKYLQLPNLTYDEHFNINFTHKVETTKRSLALYLHDDVLQLILAMKNLTESLTTPELDVKSFILSTYETLNMSLRDKMFELYPSTLSDLGLEQSLRVLLDKLQVSAPQQHDVEILFDSKNDYESEIKIELQVSIFRMVKELVQNAIKHADAQLIIVSLTSNQNYLTVVVSDDGKGFDSERISNYQASHNNFGLLSIKQEVSSLKGTFLIENKIAENQSGLYVEIKLPIN
ncbi:MAG: sensor histidine kinase, partial [Culicoidibacterales bacterium]